MSVSLRKHKYSLRLRVTFEDETSVELSIVEDSPKFSFYIRQKYLPAWQAHYGRSVKSVRHLSSIRLPEKAEVDAGQTAPNDELPPDTPPALAEFLCGCFAAKKHRESIVGDLSSEYQRYLSEGSKARADRLYWSAVLSTMWPLLRRWVLRLGWSSFGAAVLKWFGS